MFEKSLRILRLITRASWLVATISVLLLAAMPHALSLAGFDMFVVRGASMEPQIPLGSVILVKPVDPATVNAGDIISFRAPNDAVVTHRVLSVVTGDVLSFNTKGDGSNAADPVTVPAPAVIGTVEVYIPQLGFAITALATTLGAVAMIGFVGGLLLLSWFFDELITVAGHPTQRRAVAPEPAR
jgi:signal peptidase